MRLTSYELYPAKSKKVYFGYKISKYPLKVGKQGKLFNLID